MSGRKGETSESYAFDKTGRLMSASRFPDRLERLGLIEAERELREAKEAAESLLTLINEILDFSKIESGRIMLEQVPFSLRELIGDGLKSARRAGVEQGAGTGVARAGRGG